jgi:predicted ester cyclase
MLKRAMPDARAVIVRIFEVGDTVIVEGRFEGTFTGPLASPEGDVVPNGAKVDLQFADVSLIRNAKIVSYHTHYDQLGMLTQLGLMGSAEK